MILAACSHVVYDRRVELSDHPFWGNNKPAPPTSLPPQHVFDALVR